MKRFKQFPGALPDSSFDVSAIHDGYNCDSPDDVNDVSCENWDYCGDFICRGDSNNRVLYYDEVRGWVKTCFAVIKNFIFFLILLCRIFTTLNKFKKVDDERYFQHRFIPVRRNVTTNGHFYLIIHPHGHYTRKHRCLVVDHHREIYIGYDSHHATHDHSIQGHHRRFHRVSAHQLDNFTDREIRNGCTKFEEVNEF